jgi:hypothetical protein
VIEVDGMAQNTASELEEEKATKMLGAHVDKELYWKFKQVAAIRNEDLKVAIEHAARMYIDLEKGS